MALRAAATAGGPGGAGLAEAAAARRPEVHSGVCLAAAPDSCLGRPAGTSPGSGLDPARPLSASLPPLSAPPPACPVLWQGIHQCPLRGDARLSGPRPHRQGTGRARGSCPPVTPPAFAPANLPLPPLLPLCLLQAASVALCPEPGAPLCDGPRCTPGVTERPPALAWRPALGPTSACPGLLARGLLQHRAGLASNLVLFSSGISDGTFR